MAFKLNNASAENPFYGKKALKSLNELGAVNKLTESLLNQAWSEVKSDPTLIEGFFSVCFAFGEIPNRSHHLFNEDKVDGGGSGARESFELFMDWCLSNQPDYFYAFLENDLFRQYTSVWNVLRSGLRTKKGTSTITKEHTLLERIDHRRLAEYLARVINTCPEAEKVSIAKYLSRVRFSRKRKNGYRKVQARNAEILRAKVAFYKELSDAMGWGYSEHKEGNVVFTGMNAWKKEHNGVNPSVVFSSKRVLGWNSDSFIKWIEVIPALSRQRVFAIINKDDEKWTLKDGNKMKDVYKQWQASKEKAQEKVRVLSEQITMMRGVSFSANVDNEAVDPELLEQYEQAKKDAKVNVGSTNLLDLFCNLIAGNKSEAEINTMAHQILENMELRVPVFCSVDVSGSMTSMVRNNSKIHIDRGSVARLITTMLMIKNPDIELQSLVAKFSRDASIYGDEMTYGEFSENRFMKGQIKKVETIIDRTAKFTSNLANISSVIQGNGGYTNPRAVTDMVLKWINDSVNDAERSYRKDVIQRYPVFLFISDNEFNNSRTALESIQLAMRDLRSIEWDGIFVLWDVDTDSTRNSDRFDGMENVIYMNGVNAGTLNQVFKNLHNAQIIDIYTPLFSLYKSNRYEPVRQVIRTMKEEVISA